MKQSSFSLPAFYGIGLLVESISHEMKQRLQQSGFASVLLLNKGTQTSQDSFFKQASCALNKKGQISNFENLPSPFTVSYTHLTLPTIYSV